TVFNISDGSGTIECTGFIAPGKRAYPDINDGDMVAATIQVSKNNDKIRREIESISKVSDSMKGALVERMAEAIKNQASVDDIDFLVKSEKMEKLKEKMKSCASAIKRAIVEGSPIYLRHHADVDGYTGALALEQVILKLISQYHAGENDAFYKYYNRSPSKAPFYEYADVIRDVADAKRSKNRFGQKLPLVLLVDNGSTAEDVLSIRKAKIYGLKVAVIDHHNPGKVNDGKSGVDEFVDFHVNPYLVGADKNITAGMLAVEIARILGDVKEPALLCALSGVGDHAMGAEFEQYLEKCGKTVDYLKKIALCVDFEAHYLRFMADSEVITDLMYGDEKLVELLYSELFLKIEGQKKVCAHYLEYTTLKNGIVLATLDLDLITRRGEFPQAGKTIGLAHEIVCEKNKGKVVVSVGFGSDFVTIRATSNAEEKGFDVNKIVLRLKEKMLYSAAEGGGHEVAGSIKFVSGAKDEILKEFGNFVEGL
ncbi:MAG: hypothetical protein KAI53_02645, partial [Candidatus Aenigmarchaeota archaeon]|nr:hypothetical protein [Candidatus Aenigmarchaeota archaeon]